MYALFVVDLRDLGDQNIGGGACQCGKNTEGTEGNGVAGNIHQTTEENRADGHTDTVYCLEEAHGGGFLLGGDVLDAACQQHGQKRSVGKAAEDLCKVDHPHGGGVAHNDTVSGHEQKCQRNDAALTQPVGKAVTDEQCGGNLEDGEQRGRNADLGGVGAKASCHLRGEGECGCLQDHLLYNSQTGGQDNTRLLEDGQQRAQLDRLAGYLDILDEEGQHQRDDAGGKAHQQRYAVGEHRCGDGTQHKGQELTGIVVGIDVGHGSGAFLRGIVAGVHNGESNPCGCGDTGENAEEEQQHDILHQVQTQRGEGRAEAAEDDDHPVGVLDIGEDAQRDTDAHLGEAVAAHHKTNDRCGQAEGVEVRGKERHMAILGSPEKQGDEAKNQPVALGLGIDLCC